MEKLKVSPILQWKEDWEHLQNQLQRDQPGTLGSKDRKQERRDDNTLKEKKRAEKAAEKSATEMKNLMEKGKIDVEEGDDMEVTDVDYNGNFKGKKCKKIDVMGAVSNTGDRLGFSAREKAMFAASVVKSVGVAVEDTNISFSTASRKARQKRFETEEKIKKDFVKPDHVVLHWDDKILKLRAGIKYDFICVYISGAHAEKVTKLLGVPETSSGSGKEQKEVVAEMMKKWEIFEEVTGLVFDTTSSNTGHEIGACKLLEEYLEKAVLWLACRHHIYELHIKHVVEAVSGNTKDPGVKLFRRLKAEWNSLEINYSKLKKFDYNCSLSSWHTNQAMTVLAWAEHHHREGTWPRDDYKELLELIIIWLGGNVPSFNLKFPGADHHARWLSKAIYYMKLALLSNQFPMDKEEQEEVLVLAEFVALIYGKAFFKSPLSSAAPRTDLEFMYEVLQYRLYQPKLAFICLQSCFKHLWYLTPSLVVFSLCDTSLDDVQREEMAKTLFNIPRPVVFKKGKPKFPDISLHEATPVSNLSSFVSEESWLLFDLLGLQDCQEWLQTPVKMWDLFSDYRKFKEYVINVSVVNDLAERGMHLITEFASKCKNREEREAVLQVVEEHRKNFPDFSKKTLSMM